MCQEICESLIRDYPGEPGYLHNVAMACYIGKNYNGAVNYYV